MKLVFINNTLQATAENHSDELMLLGSRTPLQSATRLIRKHKKHLHMKICEFCGEKFKGLMGLHQHQAKVHKKTGELAEGAYNGLG